MSEHTCPVMNSLLVPTVTIALALALETPQDCDDVIRAAVTRKAVLLGEPTGRFGSARYGSAKHGTYTAPSAAAVAQDLDQDAPCYRPEEHGLHPLTAPGHLTCGIIGHHAEPTREADAATLAAHPLDGAL